MKILPIINTDYGHKMNLGSAHKIAGKFAQNGLADLGQTAKTIGGTVIVLAALGTKQKAQKAEDDLEGGKSAEIKNVKQTIRDELEKNREKYKESSYTQKSNINGILAHVTTEDGLNTALKMIRHPELLEANECDLRVNDFFKRISQNKEQAEIVSEIIDKLVKNPELFKKEDFNCALTYMLIYPNNEYKKNLILTFLDNPALFDYEDFIDNMPGIISDFPSYKNAEDINTREGVFRNLKYYKEFPSSLERKDEYDEPEFVRYLTHYCVRSDMK